MNSKGYILLLYIFSIGIGPAAHPVSTFDRLPRETKMQVLYGNFNSLVTSLGKEGTTGVIRIRRSSQRVIIHHDRVDLVARH